MTLCIDPEFQMYTPEDSHGTWEYTAGKKTSSNSPFFRFKLLHPRRLTWNIIMKVWKIIFLSKWMICRFHLNLPGCNLRGCIVFVQFSNQSNLGTFRTANGPPDAPRHLPENAASALPPRLLKRKKRLRWGRRLLFMTILARLPQIFIPRLENHIYIYIHI